MTSKPLRIQRQPLVDQVIEQLQQRIAQGEFEVGAKFPSEPELTDLLGVSRSTLREAVRVLVHIGLLEVRQGDGTYVRAKTAIAEPLERRLKRAAILEVYEVRRILELEIARLAAQRRDKTDLDQMQKSLQQRKCAREIGDEVAFLNADIAFHQAIAAASKNAVLIELYQTFSTALRDALAQLATDAEIDRADQAMLHERLLDAITAGDAEAAEQWTAEFLDQILLQLG